MKSFLVHGADPSLVSRALSELLVELCGEEGRLSEVEEYSPGDDSDEASGRFDLAPVLEALSTPPWLSEHRVVVVREAGALTAAQGSELAAVLTASPTENILVLSAEGRAVTPSLAKALREAGGSLVDADPGRTTRSRSDWLEARLKRASVHLDAASRRRLAEHIGEDAARLDPILERLAATYGEKAKIGPDELEPLLGEEGSVPPWELIDAIDAGDGDGAVRALRRLLRAGGRHPVQVVASLHRHVSAMLRLDGADDVGSPEEAAAMLKMPAFPARKVLTQSRRLGHDRIVRAVEVVAEADADLRGRLAWPPELVLEVAVARLAQLSRQTARPQPSGSRRR